MDIFGDGQYVALSIASIISFAVSVLLNVALLVVALTTVRKVRKSAAGLFAVSAVGGVLSLCLAPLLSVVTSRTGSPGGEGWSTMIAIQTLVMTVVHATLFGLMIAGIVQLSRQAGGGPRDPRDPDV